MSHQYDESQIFGPIDYFSDIANLVLFERAMFEDYSVKYRIKIAYYLCQYQDFEVNAWNIMNGVHNINKYKGYTLLSMHVGLI